MSSCKNTYSYFLGTTRRSSQMNTIHIVDIAHVDVHYNPSPNILSRTFPVVGNEQNLRLSTESVGLTLYTHACEV